MASEKRLIALDDIFPNRCFYVNTEDPLKSLDELINRINNAPTVDAVEVVHGRWSFGKNHGDFVEAECTACGGLLLVKWYDEIDKYRYCPNCGTKMDGDGNG